MGFSLGSFGNFLADPLGSIGRDYNAAEAQKNREWQTQMSNTSHQREVEDLKKAGLNPILSANQGAPVTSGATASTSGGNSSADFALNLANAISNIKVQSATAKKIKEETEVQKSTKKVLDNDATKKAAETALINAGLPAAALEGQMEQNYLENPVGKVLHYAGKGIKEVGPIVGGFIGGVGAHAVSALKTKRAIKKAKAATAAAKTAEFREYLGMGKGVYKK